MTRLFVQQIVQANEKHQSLSLLVLCEGNPPVTGGLPSQRTIEKRNALSHQNITLFSTSQGFTKEGSYIWAYVSPGGLWGHLDEWNATPWEQYCSQHCGYVHICVLGLINGIYAAIYGIYSAKWRQPAALYNFYFKQSAEKYVLRKDYKIYTYLDFGF